MNVYIRADAGPKIGMGHIMRTFALASEMVLRGHQVIYLSALPEGIDFLKKNGMTVIPLNYINNDISGLDIDEDAKIIETLAIKYNSLLLIDSYSADEKYVKMMRRFFAKVVNIEDYPMDLPSDAVINGNLDAESLYMDNDLRLLLCGVAFNQVRSHFRNESNYMVKNRLRTILITTGGTDMLNLVPVIVNSLLESFKREAIILHVVIGPLFNNVDYIVEKYGNRDDVILHRDVVDISIILNQIDIAISSGGSTLYELSAYGIPTIAFSMVDNQKGVIESFVSHKCIYEVKLERQDFGMEIINAVKVLASGTDLRVQLSSSAQRLVDGQGNNRIIDELEQLIGRC